MADVNPSTQLSPFGHVRFHPALSDHEARCIYQRLEDCLASARAAYVGASEALEKTSHAPAVVSLCKALQETLQQIDQAKQLGLAGLAPAADKPTVTKLRR